MFDQPIRGMETMMTMPEADARFLRRILMVLVAATLATGTMAAVATVQAERANLLIEAPAE
jgi:hypothetical protein